MKLLDQLESLIDRGIAVGMKLDPLNPVLLQWRGARTLSAVVRAEMRQPGSGINAACDQLHIPRPLRKP